VPSKARRVRAGADEQTCHSVTLLLVGFLLCEPGGIHTPLVMRRVACATSPLRPHIGGGEGQGEAGDTVSFRYSRHYIATATRGTFSATFPMATLAALEREGCGWRICSSGAGHLVGRSRSKQTRAEIRLIASKTRAIYIRLLVGGEGSSRRTIPQNRCNDWPRKGMRISGLGQHDGLWVVALHDPLLDSL
jgi:hypothetical protein